MSTIDSQAAALPVTFSLEGAKSEAHVIEFGEFDPDAAIRTISSLRTEAEDGYQRFVVAGRDAMRAHMQKVFTIYCATMDSEQGGYVVKKLQDALRAREVKVSKATSDEITFIRSVFDNLSDKSVSMYAASLKEARTFAKVLPANFAQWVLDNGGFDKIREAAANRLGDDSKTPTPKDLVAIALSSSKAQPSVDHLDSIKWRDVDGVKEAFRILIAVRNADDTAELKDACLGKDSSERTIKLYESERAERSKPSKREMSAADKFAVTQLEVSVSNAKLTLVELELKLSTHRSIGTLEQVTLLAAQVETARVLLKVQQDALRARKKIASA